MRDMDPSAELAPASTRTPAAAAVTVADLSVRLSGGAGAVDVLKGIDLRVESGSTVAVTGPSGSGKSTLMAVIGGLERPTAGRVEVCGTAYTGLDEDRLARFRRNHIGIVFQSFHLIPAMTALENVALPLELAGRRDAASRARHLLEMVGLGARVRHFPGEMSGGEQQRVAIARAVALAPRLLLADEPTGNLDAASSAVAIDLLFRLRRETAATLLLITHDPALAGRCERVVALADGRIVSDRVSGSDREPATDAAP